jgi:hypothetical protein
MAVSEEIVTSLVEAVAALNLRVNDAASRAMIQGPQGDAGPQGERGDDAQPISDQQIKDAAENWLRENITQPADGINGIDGKNGEQGRAPTEEEIQTAVDIWFLANRDTLRGSDGRNGVDGVDGVAGRDGNNGRDGRNGSDGADGVGIALVEQRDDKSFHITLTDGQETQIELPIPKVSTFYSGGGGGGGSGGATKLADLDDVAIAGILNLDILQYDADALIWRNSVGILDGGTFN